MVQKTRRRGRPRWGALGTVSEGTLRPEDLIPAFLDVAERLALSKAERNEEVRPIRARENRDYDEGALPEGEDADEARRYDLDALFTVLEAHAPAFCYFGAIEGDGADFGFWISGESLDEAIREGEVWQDDGTGLCPVCGERIKTTGRFTADGRAVGTCGDAFKLGRWEPSTCPKSARYRLVVSDHGNMTLYHRNGREVWGVV